MVKKLINNCFKQPCESPSFSFDFTYFHIFFYFTGILQQSLQTFQSAAAEGRLQWSYLECPVTPLTARHSHNMCRVGEYIYVFGGCSSSLTAFNDMWKLHLGTRVWSRVLALGKTIKRELHIEHNFLTNAGRVYKCKHLWRKILRKIQWQYLLVSFQKSPVLRKSQKSMFFAIFLSK